MRRVTSLCIALGLAIFAAQACQSASTPVADGATVSPSSTLRQGQDAISLVVTRAAGGLADATSFDLGGLVVERQPQSTDARLVLAISVPHGVALGMRTLTYSDARGPVSLPNVVEVDAITSAPAGADTNLGTSVAPFRTVKHAIEVAGAGDTIQLLDGAYDTSTGETWGYAAPASLTILGQSTTGTALSGAPAGDPGVPGTTAFVAPAGLTMKSLTLGAFDTAISATGAGTLALNDLTVSGALTAAVDAEAAGVTIAVAGGTLGAQQDAILLGDHCASCALNVMNASLTGALLQGQGHTVEMSAMATGSQVVLQKVDVNGDISVKDASATLSVSGSTFKEDGTGAQTLIDFGGHALDVTDSTFTLSGDTFGINLATGALSLSGVTIQGGGYGVYQLGGTSKLRGTQLRNYGYMGYYLAQGDLDLGTATEPGNNALSSTTTGQSVFGLYVDGIIHPVTSSNTTFDGVEPPAGTQAAAPDQMIEVPGEYIINYGKEILFWTL